MTRYGRGREMDNSNLLGDIFTMAFLYDFSSSGSSTKKMEIENFHKRIISVDFFVCMVDIFTPFLLYICNK